MADVYYSGTVQAVAKRMRATVTTASTGSVYSITVTGAGRTVSYTAVAGDTTAAIASNLAAAFSGSTYPELRELTAGVPNDDPTAIDVTGPADGAPFTITVGATGGGAIGVATPVAAKSPHDAADVLNYSTGALPTTGDRLILQAGSNGPKYGLATLTAVALLAFVRYRSHRGQIGLPETNPSGFREYRPRFFELSATTYYVECSDADAAEQVNVKVTKATAVTINVMGPGGSFGTTTTPTVLLHNAPAASVLTGSGASVGVALAEAQASTFGTVTLSDGLFRAGPGTTLGNVTLSNMAGEIGSNYTTLTVVGQSSEVEVTVAAGSTAGAGLVGTTVEDGAVRWRSTGDPGDKVTVGGNGTFDLRPAPATMPVVEYLMHANSIVDDSYNRSPAGTKFTTVNCTLEEVTLTTGPNKTFTI